MRAILGFTAGAFAVNLVGGIVLLGVGARIAELAPHPRPDLLHWGEIVVGVAAIVGAGVLWRRRGQLRERFARAELVAHRFAPLAGATVAAVELPTAVPYFAVIAALSASDQPPAVQILLIVVFNVIFLAPVLAIALARAFAGPRAEAVLARIRALVLHHSGAAAAWLSLALGVALVVLGLVGLI